MYLQVKKQKLTCLQLGMKRDELSYTVLVTHLVMFSFPQPLSWPVLCSRSENEHESHPPPQAAPGMLSFDYQQQHEKSVAWMDDHWAVLDCNDL